MQKTRQAILAYLERQQQATAGELSRVLDLTPANIRHHLKELERRGFIQEAGQATTRGRGRPTKIYSATTRGSTEVLIRFIELLWAEFVTDPSTRTRQGHLKRLARRLAAGQDPSVGTLPHRLGSTIRSLHELGYRAHWEAHVDSPRIVLERCPFGDLQSQLPDICRLDAAVVSGLLGEPVEQRTVRSLGVPGRAGCAFQVGKRPPDPMEPIRGSS
jgi:predicted ArsR family transcriptional regulator